MKKRLLLILAMSFSFSYAQMAKDMVVYKTPYCGCCTNWIVQMKDKGFNVKTIVQKNFDALKRKNGISQANSSCHTAFVGGYAIEGHVNYSAIQRLLREKPKNIVALSVPGMVVGSPGMEMGNKKMPYNIVAIRNDGSTFTYERH